MVPTNAPLPIETRNQSILYSQFVLHAIEQIGYPILHIFELDALTAMQSCLDLIRENRGLSIKQDTIPLNDAPTYAMIARGETEGVFHLDSDHTRIVLQKLKQCCFNELMAFIVLNSIKPDKRLNDYVKRRKSRQEYLHPILRSILAETHGMIIYHEQIISLLKQIAGYTEVEANNFKKVLIHGKPKEIKQIYGTLTANAIEHGLTEPVINHIISLFKGYGRMAFPQYHAMALTKIAYHSAWLKANFNDEFCETRKTYEVDSKEES